MSKLVVIIVNWNTGRLLAECLDSLSMLPTEDRQLIAEVIVVDNASTDRSIALAKLTVGKTNNQPPVRFIPQSSNIGFAAANNIALERIMAREDKPHVLLLNPDTQAKPGAISTLLRGLADNGRTGIVGPKLLNPDGSIQPSVRTFPSLTVFLIMFFKLHRILPRLKPYQKYLQTDFDYSQPANVDQVMGAAFLIRHSVIEKVGFLDERFWLWFEEVDYCRRAKQAGWQINYFPVAQIIHYGGVSFDQLNGFIRSWQWIFASLKYAQKHLPLVQTIFLYLTTPLALIIATIGAIVHSSLLVIK